MNKGTKYIHGFPDDALGKIKGFPYYCICEAPCVYGNIWTKMGCTVRAYANPLVEIYLKNRETILVPIFV